MGKPVPLSDCRTGLVFDTTILIDIWKDREQQSHIFNLYMRIPRGFRFTTIVNKIEFLVGIDDKEFKERRKWLDDAGIRQLHITKEASESFWNLFRSYRFSTELFKDYLISAITLHNGFVIATNNVKDFKKIRGLNWIDEFDRRRGDKIQ